MRPTHNPQPTTQPNPAPPPQKALYNVETTYDETVYTTRLDRDRCGISEAEAARIAHEIERGNTNNPHLQEERGQVVDDSGVSLDGPAGLVGGGAGRSAVWVQVVAPADSQ